MEQPGPGLHTFIVDEFSGSAVSIFNLPLIYRL
jgi:hypothetical protein